MTLAMIVGHDRHQRYLGRALRKDTLAHAYLFSGPEEVGKRTMALACAQSLLCRALPEALGGCGSCESCRVASDLRHPDLVFLSREQPLVESGGQRDIGIKSVRELSRRLSLAPWAGGRKVAIIDGAERLSHDAQSAFLKTLEDPPRTTTFFLIASQSGGLLSTVVSRAVVLSFGVVPDAAMALLLRGVPVGQHAALLRIAAGRPGALVRFARDAEALTRAETSERCFGALLAGDLAERFTFSDRTSRDPGELESCVASLSRTLRAELHRRASAPGSAVPVARALESLLRAHTLLAAVAVNRRLLADWLFVSLPVLNAPAPP